ncbi:pirin family protein [Microbulbifer elongatus]|uniref:pirin family protein n=1 Tax=Microbulbifer elongatus TaxID=86173 RepID=UPI001CFE82EC|nr:pirin family protein [Microbulbifer elongatus]
MSIQERKPEGDCKFESGCDAITLVIDPREKDLGGFAVRRTLPNSRQKTVGPWIFFDHMGPAEFEPGKGINVRPHPHINLATVTYLFEGEILHRDSLGSLQPIRPGDVNLMVAGKGIVHSERERPEVTAARHRLHGLQLWLALPEADEEIDPAFYHYPSTEIPETNVDGVPVRVIMGQAYGTESPVKTHAETLYIEARLKAGQKLVLPDAEERALYVVEGSAQSRSVQLPCHTMAVFKQESGVEIEAREDCLLALIGGEPVGQRFVDWNFVSSRKDRIECARADWVNGNFPVVPGDQEEFIPLPD